MDLELLKQGARLCGIEMTHQPSDTAVRLWIPWECVLCIEDAHAIICARLREMCKDKDWMVDSFDDDEFSVTRLDRKRPPHEHIRAPDELAALVEALSDDA